MHEDYHFYNSYITRYCEAFSGNLGNMRGPCSITPRTPIKWKILYINQEGNILSN